MDQTNNRSFHAYLEASYLHRQVYDEILMPFVDLIAHMRDWQTELNVYLEGAKGELPDTHPDRPKFDLVKQIIDVTIFGIQVSQPQFHHFRSMIVHQADVAYSQVTRLIAIPPTPLNHTIQWSISNEYLFVDKKSVGLDGRDIKLLYDALQDTGRREHLSNKVTGAPAGMLWYAHDYGRNRILALTAASWGERTIKVPKSGTVNKGDHRFP